MWWAISSFKRQTHRTLNARPRCKVWTHCATMAQERCFLVRRRSKRSSPQRKKTSSWTSSHYGSLRISRDTHRIRQKRQGCARRRESEGLAWSAAPGRDPADRGYRGERASPASQARHRSVFGAATSERLRRRDHDPAACDVGSRWGTPDRFLERTDGTGRKGILSASARTGTRKRQSGHFIRQEPGATSERLPCTLFKHGRCG